MAYQINIDDKQAYEWLKKLINNTIESPQSRPYQTAYQELLAWKVAFDKCDELREAAAAERKKVRSTPTTVSRKRTVKRSRKEISEFDCPDHITYGGVRVPRTDCAKCWSIYKKLHPMEYERARRKFNLKSKSHEK